MRTGNTTLQQELDLQGVNLEARLPTIDPSIEIGRFQTQQGRGRLFLKPETKDFWMEQDHQYLTKVPRKYQGALRRLYQ